MRVGGRASGWARTNTREPRRIERAFGSRSSLARHGRRSVGRYVATGAGRAGLAQVHPLPRTRE